MAVRDTWSVRQARWLNRIHARRAAMARVNTGFQTSPEPRTIGTFAKGRQLTAGNFLFAGQLIVSDDVSIWDLPGQSASFTEEIHGFTWLDDLAAVGDAAARKRAQQWTWDWLNEYAGGLGPGWTPDLTGRRLIRLINNALFLLPGADSAMSRTFFNSLGRQTIYLSRRWPSATLGLPRFEALTGLIYAGLALIDMERHVGRAVSALARDCEEHIDIEGGIATRNPEELLEVFTLLNWAVSALTESGKLPPRDILAAIERIAPTLRALRHADGGLARFHGGGRGQEGKLDQALAASGVKSVNDDGLAMGYARLAAGRTSVIVDSSVPPRGPHSANAHASTLAFELSSGRRPVVVNCGSGVSFGAEWRRAGRATPSHSTLGIEGASSSRLGPTVSVNGHPREYLVQTPRDVRIERRQEDGQDGPSTGLVAGHDGYVRSHGLTHIRHLMLTDDSRMLSGEDTLAALDRADERRFDKARDSAGLGGVPYQIRFHLHPDIDASIDMGGAAVSMALKSGEIWVFRHDGAAELALEPSVYLEKGRLKPRATKQVVLSSFAIDYASRVRWTLAKAQDTPSVLRDLEPKDDGTDD